ESPARSIASSSLFKSFSRGITLCQIYKRNERNIPWLGSTIDGRKKGDRVCLNCRCKYCLFFLPALILPNGRLFSEMVTPRNDERLFSNPGTREPSYFIMTSFFMDGFLVRGC